jgi:hypothetical protein
MGSPKLLPCRASCVSSTWGAEVGVGARLRPCTMLLTELVRAQPFGGGCAPADDDGSSAAAVNGTPTLGKASATCIPVQSEWWGGVGWGRVGQRGIMHTNPRNPGVRARLGAWPTPQHS